MEAGVACRVTVVRMRSRHKYIQHLMAHEAQGSMGRVKNACLMFIMHACRWEKEEAYEYIYI